MSENIVVLKVNDKEIDIKGFVENALKGLNVGFFTELRLPNDIELERDIKSFRLQIIPNPPKEKPVKVRVNVNGKHIGLKPFVQDFIESYNLGAIKSLKDIPENIEKVIMNYNE